MHFYLPINIDGRRLHCFKLQDAETVTSKPLFSFIVKVTDNVRLLSIDSDRPQLISSGGLNYSQNLTGHVHRFRVERTQEMTDGVPTYRIHIEKGKAPADVNDNSYLKAYGYMGAEEEEDHAVVKIDGTRVVNRASGMLNEPVFVIIISYKFEGKVYEDSAKIYLYTDDQQLTSAALDFGSEASQIRFAGNDGNNSIIDTLLSFQEGAQYSKDEVFWQGKSGDPLFKSVFFIHKKPDTTKYAAKPPVGSPNAFVQPLLKSSTISETYKSLEILPNLKLIEIGRGLISFNNEPIEFDEESNIETGDNPNLSSRPLRESILRIILNNFLHCMLHDIGRSKQKEKFLRLVLMVPNVYYQSKIYSLVRGLYEDFATIQAGNNYPTCKGIEVQVVSESDAAFFGVRYTRKDFKNEKDGYSLIIDAGKGTTDFSILQQHECFADFSSLYRDGIPASGNVLTYAFYEALNDFMHKHKIDLTPLLRTDVKSELLSFMDLLEQLKKDYDSTDKTFETPKETNIDDLRKFVTYLSNQVRSRRQIPDCKAFVDRKVRLLCDSLERSMNSFMKTNEPIRFFQVLLTGRGFLFEPYKRAVIEMLKKNKWIEDEKDVIPIIGDQAKTICLEGALVIEKACSVNCNSGLIGSPIIRHATGSGNWIQRFLKKPYKQSKKEKFKGIDIDFFYQGSARNTSQNITFVIAGREYTVSSPDSQKKALFYTGDGFICLKEDDCIDIDERNLMYTDEKINQLIKESLFPFYPGSIRDEHDKSWEDASKEPEHPEEKDNVAKSDDHTRQEDASKEPEYPEEEGVKVNSEKEKLEKLDQNIMDD